MSIVLDERLYAAASLVRDGAYVCDVGTDHAYLPCALMQMGKISGGMAMDINEGPLENANRTIEAYRLQESIVTRLSDGLDALTEEEQNRITDVMICGMGGELIDTLIGRADWLKNAEKCLILQPMTQIPYLRKALYRKGYSIVEEIPIVDKNHLYTVIKAVYTGEAVAIDEFFAQVGKVMENESEMAKQYLNVVSGRLKKAAMGMAKSESKQAEAAEMFALADRIVASVAPSVTVGDIYALIDEWAPFETQCSWDHSGLQTGSKNHTVTGIVTALDCTEDVVDYAIKVKANLIIAHHPLIFAPLFAVCDDSVVAKLVKNDISLICAHTNLDLAKNGVNDCLCRVLDLKEVHAFGEDDLGRIGTLEAAMQPEAFAAYVKQKLHTALIWWEGDREVKTVALVGGAGSDYAADAALCGADAYLTGELKHNYFADLSASGMTMLSAGHYATEAVMLPKIKEKILKRFASVPVQVFEPVQMKAM